MAVPASEQVEDPSERQEEPGKSGGKREGKNKLAQQRVAGSPKRKTTGGVPLSHIRKLNDRVRGGSRVDDRVGDDEDNDSPVPPVTIAALGAVRRNRRCSTVYRPVPTDDDGENRCLAPDAPIMSRVISAQERRSLDVRHVALAEPFGDQVEQRRKNITRMGNVQLFQRLMRTPSPKGVPVECAIRRAVP